MSMGIENIEIIPKWSLDGFPDFFVAANNKIYRRGRGKAVNMVMKKYTKGFYLDRKFYSLMYLRKCLKRIEL